MKRIGTAPAPTPSRAAAVDWTLAVCSQVDPDLHYPPSEHPKHRQQIAQARAVCARCPLTGTNGPCLARALDAEHGKPLEHRSGIYGGTTARERYDMEKETV